MLLELTVFHRNVSLRIMDQELNHKPVRLLLLAVDGLFRGSLRHFLDLQPGFHVEGECGSISAALETLRGGAVDTTVVSLDLGADHGNDFIAAARDQGYNGRFLVVAGAEDVRGSAVALHMGASGIFMKSDPPEKLLQAIRRVSDGEVWMDPRVLQLMADRLAAQPPGLTGTEPPPVIGGRDQRVLLGVIGGLSSKKIGEGLGISESSVKSILQRLFLRAGVRTRSQLVRVALEGSLQSIGHTSRPAFQPGATLPKRRQGTQEDNLSANPL
jgi:DNA-binding NarL/FixJ family response regulator